MLRTFPNPYFMECRIYKKSWNESVLTKDDSAIMREIAAMFVVFSHYVDLMKGRGMNNLGPASLMEHRGGLGVYVLFFSYILLI